MTRKCSLRIELTVLVFSGRYRDLSGFLFVADRHFHFSHFHFWLLPRRLTQCAFAKRRRLRPTSLLIVRPTKKTFTSQTKMLCLYTSYKHLQASQADWNRQVHVHAGIPSITLSHCGHGHNLTSVANSLSSTQLTLEVLLLKHWCRSAFAETPLAGFTASIDI